MDRSIFKWSLVVNISKVRVLEFHFVSCLSHMWRLYNHVTHEGQCEIIVKLKCFTCQVSFVVVDDWFPWSFFKDSFAWNLLADVVNKPEQQHVSFRLSWKVSSSNYPNQWFCIGLTARFLENKWWTKFVSAFI